MPKIFKENKFALFIANITCIFVWIILTKTILNLIISENEPFYIYRIKDLLTFLPPIWLTYYLWIRRKGFK